MPRQLLLHEGEQGCGFDRETAGDADDVDEAHVSNPPFDVTDVRAMEPDQLSEALLGQAAFHSKLAHRVPEGDQKVSRSVGRMHGPTLWAVMTMRLQTLSGITASDWLTCGEPIHRMAAVEGYEP